MIQKDLIELNFEINEIYKPKLVRVIYSNRETIEAIDLINTAIQKLFKSTSSKRLILESLTHRLISQTK